MLIKCKKTGTLLHLGYYSQLQLSWSVKLSVSSSVCFLKITEYYFLKLCRDFFGISLMVLNTQKCFYISPLGVCFEVFFVHFSYCVFYAPLFRQSFLILTFTFGKYFFLRCPPVLGGHFEVFLGSFWGMFFYFWRIVSHILMKFCGVYNWDYSHGHFSQNKKIHSSSPLLGTILGYFLASCGIFLYSFIVWELFNLFSRNLVQIFLKFSWQTLPYFFHSMSHFNGYYFGVSSSIFWKLFNIFPWNFSQIFLVLVWWSIN